MSWKEMDAMSIRKSLCTGTTRGSNIRELCRRYGISSRTAYKWIKRYDRQGKQDWRIGGNDQAQSANGRQTEGSGQVLRNGKPGWGGRKIAQVLRIKGKKMPASQHHHRYSAADREDWRRAKGQKLPGSAMNASRPNELWQMDFKGHFAMLNGRLSSVDRAG